MTLVALFPPGRRRIALVCLLALVAMSAVRADDANELGGGRIEFHGGQYGLPSSVRISFGDFAEQENEVRFFGYVVIDAGDTRIQADEVIYRRAPDVFEAKGNVVLAFPGATLAGSHLVYQIEPQTGTMEDVVGYVDQGNAILHAQKLEKRGPDLLYVEHAVFTTCTQPTPYWSFRLSSGLFRLGDYAYLHGVTFRTPHVPLFYTPYMVWPIKTGRAAGLLFPEFGSSNKLGVSAGLPFYWPFASNADLTLKVTGYTKVGVGLDALLDWLPSWQGWAKGDFRFINDQVKKKNRYLAAWRHQQRFSAETQFTAELERVSDFDYFTDYETDLLRSSSPETRSTLDLTRSWSWYSASLRARRYVQFFVAGSEALSGESVSNILPQLELRGRSRRIGRTPFFLSFVSSLSGFAKEVLGPPPDQATVATEDELVSLKRTHWQRADLAPQLQIPLLKSAWGDLVATGGWRGTWYSERVDPNDSTNLISKSLFRNLWNAGLSFAGPRFERVYRTPDWSFSPKLKHVLEPFLAYSWRPLSGTKQSEIPVFDEIDSVPGQLSDITYGLRQRFVALRRSATGRASGLASATETSFAGLEAQSKDEKQREEQAKNAPGVADKPEVDETLNPVEIGSVEIAQDYSFVRSLTTLYSAVRDPATGLVSNVVVGTRSYSPIRIRVHFNPTSEQVADVNYTFDPANGQLTETSISALTRLSDRSYFSGRWFRRTPPAPGLSSESFLRAKWGVVSLSQRFSLETEWDYNWQSRNLDHQRYEVRWATQCCSFRFGFDQRAFPTDYRREYSLTVDLSGLGQVLNLRTTQ